MTTDEHWMTLALQEAAMAAEKGEVPVGAVVLSDGELISQAHNLRETDQDPLAHAELIALKGAADRLGSWRLVGCTLFVTLEPCAMCAGALVNSRIERVVFAASDPKAGYCGSLGNIVQDERLNHRVEVCRGVLQKKSTAMLKSFFAALRQSGSPASLVTSERLI